MKLNFPLFASRRLAFASLIVLIPKLLNAQGTVYISNLGTLGGGGGNINATSWVALGIETGGNSQGYVLDSVEVHMAAATGSPSGFTLSLFSTASGLPSQSLGVLTGSANPASSGVYTYDASALNLTLAPSTEYFVVENATSLPSQGSYEWGITGGGTTTVGGWQDVSTEFSNDQGNDWSPLFRTPLQIAVTATAVPESSTWVLFLIGGGFAFYFHARKQPKQA